MVKIISELCIGCGHCLFICPVQSIKFKDKKAFIDQDLCVECSVCLRSHVCEERAIKFQELKMPRLIRNPFSDVVAVHQLTGVAGRGTEEMKTNDVTDRFKLGEIGFSIEIGRPGVGCLLSTLELFTVTLSELGVEFEKNSPVTALFIDEKGHIQEDIKNERVLSAIIEFKINSPQKAVEVLNLIKKVDKIIDTVFSVGVVSRFEDGEIPVLDLLTEQGFSVRPNAKINLGLGKIEEGS